MKYLAIAILMMSLNAASATKTWKWKAVTEDTNDKPIDIDYYNAYCGDEPPVKVLPPKLEYAQRLMKAGVHSCYITAVADEIESEPSEVAKTEIYAPKRVIIIIIE